MLYDNTSHNYTLKESIEYQLDGFKVANYPRGTKKLDLVVKPGEQKLIKLQVMPGHSRPRFSQSYSYQLI